MHVAVSSIEKLSDYVINTPEDGLSSNSSVHTMMNIIEKNRLQESVKKNGEEKKMHHA
jgi:4-O-beta-D-mannosyl-D-glucose phosphorylase